ncbi:DNase TatD [Spirochaetia bacterium]|nr:DNase TatD [Spirochaetia bacterium]
MNLIDIGVNLMSPSFDRDRDGVIAAAAAAGVSPLIITGASVAGSRAALAYAAEKLPSEAIRETALTSSAGNTDASPKAAHQLYTTAGVHPHDAKSCGPNTVALLRELAGHPLVAAIGECGLDYNRDFSLRPIQREWFEAQILLAVELGLPLFLHERDASSDFAAILKNHRGNITRMVVHCFTGTEAELETYLELGAYIGITGWICDERRGRHLASLVKTIPADRLMIETDAPYLIPRDLQPRTLGPMPLERRRSGRNEPRFLPHIATVIAGHLGKEPEQLAAETYANSLRFFALP